MAPILLAWSPIGKGLAGIVPFGLLMLAGGAALLWLGRTQEKVAAPVIHDRHWEPVEKASSDQGTPLSSFDEKAYEHWRSYKGETGSNRGPTTPYPRPTSWSTAVFDVIEWRRFEAVVETLFQQAGFETKSQSHGADQGVDVWLYSNS